MSIPAVTTYLNYFRQGLSPSDVLPFGKTPFQGSSAGLSSALTEVIKTLAPATNLDQAQIQEYFQRSIVCAAPAVDHHFWLINDPINLLDDLRSTYQDVLDKHDPFWQLPLDRWLQEVDPLVFAKATVKIPFLSGLHMRPSQTLALKIQGLSKSAPDIWLRFLNPKGVDICARASEASAVMMLGPEKNDQVDIFAFGKQARKALPGLVDFIVRDHMFLSEDLVTETKVVERPRRVYRGLASNTLATGYYRNILLYTVPFDDNLAVVGYKQADPQLQLKDRIQVRRAFKNIANNPLWLDADQAKLLPDKLKVLYRLLYQKTLENIKSKKLSHRYAFLIAYRGLKKEVEEGRHGPGLLLYQDLFNRLARELLTAMIFPTKLFDRTDPTEKKEALIKAEGLRLSEQGLALSELLRSQDKDPLASLLQQVLDGILIKVREEGEPAWKIISKHHDEILAQVEKDIKGQTQFPKTIITELDLWLGVLSDTLRKEKTFILPQDGSIMGIIGGKIKIEVELFEEVFDQIDFYYRTRKQESYDQIKDRLAEFHDTVKNLIINGHYFAKAAIREATIRLQQELAAGPEADKIGALLEFSRRLILELQSSQGEGTLPEESAVLVVADKVIPESIVPIVKRFGVKLIICPNDCLTEPWVNQVEELGVAVIGGVRYGRHLSFDDVLTYDALTGKITINPDPEKIRAIKDQEIRLAYSVRQKSGLAVQQAGSEFSQIGQPAPAGGSDRLSNIIGFRPIVPLDLWQPGIWSKSRDVGCHDLGLVFTESLYRIRHVDPVEETLIFTFLRLANGGSGLVTVFAYDKRIFGFGSNDILYTESEEVSIIRKEIRALLQANARSDHHNLRLVFPMVSSDEQAARLISWCKQEEQSLAAKGLIDSPRQRQRSLPVGFALETMTALQKFSPLYKMADFIYLGLDDLLNDLAWYNGRPLGKELIIHGDLLRYLLKMRAEVDTLVKRGFLPPGKNRIGVGGQLATQLKFMLLLSALAVDSEIEFFILSPLNKIPWLRRQAAEIDPQHVLELFQGSIADTKAETAERLLAHEEARIKKIIASFGQT